MRLDRTRAALGLLSMLAVALAGCESAPSSGEVVIAGVVAVPKSRGELAGGFGQLHAALRAGVGRGEAAAGRLWLAQCLEADPTAPDGLLPRVATLVLPPGETAAFGALVQVDTLRGAHAADRRRHGRFVARVAERTPPPGAEAPGWRTYFGRPSPLCRADGMPEGRWQVQLRGAVAAWEIDFAQAELARHDSLGDDELAAGRVVVASCQLKVMDGSDWTRLSWVARVPGGQALAVGDVVRLRAGAEESGGRVAPLAQVLGPAPGSAAASASAAAAAPGRERSAGHQVPPCRGTTAGA